MVSVTDINRIPGVRKVLGSTIGRKLEEHTEATYEQMIGNWEQGRDAMGRGWAPLKQSTVQNKGHATPLIETRDMINSAGYEVDRGDLEAIIFIDDIKAGIHENGAPDQNIPPRPIINPAAEYFETQTEGMIGDSVDYSLDISDNAGISGGIGGV